MKKYLGEDFLNKIFKDLANSDEVKHTGRGGDKNLDVRLYMERLERVTDRALSHDNLRLLKEAYYNKYVIKPENVPNSYFELQQQIALDRGYGHLEYTDELKKQEIEQIISEQKASLDSWIEYFASTDTEMYPTWFKYFCFQGMIKLGYFDKEKDKFTRRTDSTTKPFIEINREALAMMYDELIKVLNKEEIDDNKLEELLKNGSFSKIYAYCIKKLDSVKKDNTNSDEGIWKKYNQGTDPNILFNDIHGKGTGWCTAGGIETATQHLNGGDFYVYFTKDKNGEYTCPRIAIRTDYGKIAEIRGIAENQNLESNMEKVVDKKLEEFPDKEEYKKKCVDMEILTYIYNKWKNNKDAEFTKEELKFLYEIDNEINGFGYQRDPRIKEIISSRNIKKDLAFLFNCNENQISLTKEEALSGNIIYHYGNLDLSSLESAEGLVLPEVINGFLYLNNLESAEGLVLPKKIKGYLALSRLTSVEGLVLPNEINEGLYLCGLESAEGLVLPEKINGELNLGGLKSAKDLVLPKEFNGTLVLRGLTCAKDLVLPKEINGNLDLRGLTSAKDLVLPKEINGNLDLRGLTSAKDLVLPKEVNGCLYLNRLKSAEGLILPEKISGELDLRGLISAEGLVLPNEINEGLYLCGLESSEGLVLPEKISGELNLGGLKNAKDLVLPKKINRILDLGGLESAEGLVLPEIIDGFLDLKSLKTAEGLIISDELKCSLYCPLANNNINVLKEMCKNNKLDNEIRKTK